MRRRDEAGDGERRRTSRSAGVLPLVAAVTSALALTGAAFYTVQSASSCGQPGQYVRHDNQFELVGGCLDDTDLSGLPPAPARSSGQTDSYHNYRP